MPNKVLLKKSSVAAKVPLITDLDYGELAVNYTDGKLYYKTATNTIGAFTTNTGTVTSVSMTVPTGLTVSGSPITSSGTLAVTLSSGYSIPTTASQTQWDTAYTDRNKWDGGSTGLVAATGRTSLGATTLGSNLFTLSNVAAISFPRFNSDNTISSLDAASFRTAIGAGTSSTTGTVTSVSGTGTVSGLTLTGTVTTSGNLTLGGTLALTSGDITTGLGYTPLNKAGDTVDGAFTVTDSLFTIQDETDNTKKAQFQLSGITTGTTRTYTLPNASVTLAGTNVANTFSSTNTFSAATVTVGTSTATSTYGLGTGATLSGNTKTVNIGTNGVSGSTTNINIGSTNGTSVAANGTWTFGTDIAGSITGNAATVSNGVYLNDTQTLTNKTITGLKETRTAIPASAIDLSTGTFFTRTISGATTLTIYNAAAAGTANSFILELTNAGSAAITWFSGVKWTGGTAPSLTAAGVDILGFYTHDGGTTWRGMLLSLDNK